MISASAEYLAKVNNGDVPLCRMQLTTASGRVLWLEDGQFWGNSISFSDATSQDGAFAVGSAVIGNFTFSLTNFDRSLDSIDFAGAVVVPFIYYTIDGTNEYLPKGVFYVTSHTTSGNIIKCVAMDGLKLFDQTQTTITYPITAQSLIETLCTANGITLATTTIPNGDFSLSQPTDASGTATVLTDRQMLSYACQCIGCFAKMNEYGELEIKWYDFENPVVISTTFSGKTLWTHPIQVDEIRVKTTADNETVETVYDTSDIDQTVLDEITLDSYPTKTVSGEIVTFDDGADGVPCTVTTTGTEVTRSSQNVLEIYSRSGTVVDVTYTVNSDGSVTLNGTATATSGITLNRSTSVRNLPSGEWYLKLLGDAPSGLTLQAYCDGSSKLITQSGVLTIPSGTTKNHIRLRIATGTVFDNLTVYPMVVYGSEEPTVFKVHSGDTLTVSDTSDTLTTCQGYNCIWADDEASITVTYRVDRGLYDTRALTIGENPYILESNKLAVFTNIATSIFGAVFRPGSLPVLGNPCLQSGDVLQVTDRTNDTTYLMPITQTTYNKTITQTVICAFEQKEDADLRPSSSYNMNVSVQNALEQAQTADTIARVAQELAEKSGYEAVIRSNKGNSFGQDTTADLTALIFDVDMNEIDADGTEYLYRWWVAKDSTASVYLDGGKNINIDIADPLCNYTASMYFEVLNIDRGIYPFTLSNRSDVILTTRDGTMLTARAAESVTT